MKTIRTDQTGGAPLKQKMISKIQESYFELFFSMLNFLGVNESSGHFIINGCEAISGNITPGWMFINGDLVKFSGTTGDENTKFIKAITAETVGFANGENKPLYYTSVVQVDPSGTKLSDFIKIKQIVELPEGLVVDPAYGSEPAEPTLIERIAEIEKKVKVFQAGGGMVLWNKPAIEIPAGWAEVVDWRGRMPIGYKSSDVDFNVLGAVGGSKTQTLVSGNLPKENIRPIVNGSTYNASVVKTDGGVVDQTTDPVAFGIMNPYKIVFFIEYIG